MGRAATGGATAAGLAVGDGARNDAFRSLGSRAGEDLDEVVLGLPGRDAVAFGRGAAKTAFRSGFTGGRDASRNGLAKTGVRWPFLEGLDHS